jgi:hypothetical protein
VCAFWVTLGGSRTKEQYLGDGGALYNNFTVSGLESFIDVPLTLFRMTLVDEYDLDVSFFNLNNHRDG